MKEMIGVFMQSKTQPYQYLVLACGIAGLLLVPELASAQVTNNFKSVFESGLTFLRTVGSFVCVAAVMRAAMRFFSEDRPEAGMGYMFRTLGGCAVFFGATGIVRFVASFFPNMSINF
jgi:hypothetical protein